MTLSAAILIFCLLALLFFIIAARQVRRRRLGRSIASGLSATVLLALAACAALLAANFRTYQRLSIEQPAGELEFHQTGKQQFNGVLTYPNGEHAAFALRGDEWQIDARILKWQAFANLMGFDAAYRLERISGRYARIDDERGQPHTVFPLNPPGSTDLWALIRRYHAWLPWIDALYGSATYLPMADGALFEVKVSQSGLLARPLNQAARDSVGSWR